MVIRLISRASWTIAKCKYLSISTINILIHSQSFLGLFKPSQSTYMVRTHKYLPVCESICGWHRYCYIIHWYSDKAIGSVCSVKNGCLGWDSNRRPSAFQAQLSYQDSLAGWAIFCIHSNQHVRVQCIYICILCRSCDSQLIIEWLNWCTATNLIIFFLTL